MVHGATEARRAEEAAAVLFTAGIARLDAETLEGALEMPRPPRSLAGSWTAS